VGDSEDSEDSEDSAPRQRIFQKCQLVDQLVVDSVDMVLVKRKLLMEMLTRHLPLLVRDLRLTVQHLEQELFELTSTFHLRDSFASFGPQYWRVFTLVFLQALSLRNEVLRKELGVEDGELLEELVTACGLRSDEFRILVEGVSSTTPEKGT